MVTLKVWGVQHFPLAHASLLCSRVQWPPFTSLEILRGKDLTIPGWLAPIKEHLCANCLGTGLGPRGTPKQVGSSQTDFLEMRENPRPAIVTAGKGSTSKLSVAATPGFSRCVHRLGEGGAVSASGPVTAPRLGVGVSASFTPVAFAPLPVGCSTPSPPEDVVSPGCSQAGLPIRGPAPCRSRSGGLQRLMRAHAPGAGFLEKGFKGVHCPHWFQSLSSVLGAPHPISIP